MAVTKSLQRARAAFYLVLIFLCGALAGAVTTNLWQRGLPLGISSARADAPQKRLPAVDWFTQQLTLSTDQRQKLSQILDETHNAYVGPEQELTKIREQGNARIRALLSDDQKVKFDQLVAKREAERKRNHRP